MISPCKETGGDFTPGWNILSITSRLTQELLKSCSYLKITFLNLKHYLNFFFLKINIQVLFSFALFLLSSLSTLVKTEDSQHTSVKNTMVLLLCSELVCCIIFSSYLRYFNTLHQKTANVLGMNVAHETMQILRKFTNRFKNYIVWNIF